MSKLSWLISYRLFSMEQTKIHSSRQNNKIGTYMVPLATVILRLTRTGFGFDLLPYCLNAWRTETACCFRLQTVPPSSIFATFASLPLEKKRIETVSNVCLPKTFYFSFDSRNVNRMETLRLILNHPQLISLPYVLLHIEFLLKLYSKC